MANTQRRGLARGLAVEYLARQRGLAAPEVQNDEELKTTGAKELSAARAQLEKAIKRAYQHVVYLAQPDPEGERYLDQLTFEDDNLTALDGTVIWKGLADRDKVFDKGQFGPKALLHNLRDTDYGKTLSDIRAAFYNAPRLPLLYNGDRDLQQAIYDTVNQGLLRIADGTGTDVAVTAPTQVNLSSTGLRLEKPLPKTCPKCGQPAHEGECPASGGGPGGQNAGGSTSAGGSSQSGGDTQPTGGGTSSSDTTDSGKEQQVAFSFTSNLLASEDSADQFAALFKAFYMALDERHISYLQGTIRLVLQGEAAAQVQQRLTDLGITATFKDI